MGPRVYFLVVDVDRSYLALPQHCPEVPVVNPSSGRLVPVALLTRDRRVMAENDGAGRYGPRYISRG